MKGNFFVGIPTLGFLVGILCNPPYNITPISHQSGIFFHNFGLAKISNDQFTLLSLTNASFYTEKFNVIKSAARRCDNVCGHVTQEKHIDLHCNTSIKDSQQSVETFQGKLETIKHLLRHNIHKSRKRSIRRSKLCYKLAFQYTRRQGRSVLFRIHFHPIA